MPYEIPTYNDILTEIQNDLLAEFPDLNVRESNSFIGAENRAYARQVHGLYQLLTSLASEPFASSASRPNLERIGEDIGVRGPRAATYATGNINITGTANQQYNTGLEFSTQRGLRYMVVRGGTLDGNGRGQASVRAVSRGSRYNIAAGTRLTSTVASITATVATAGISGGVNEESLLAFRTRLINRQASGALIGTASDWETWVRRYAGVTNVWVAFGEFNAGTVTVRFEIDDAAHQNGVPTDADIAAVTNILNERVNNYVRFRVVKQIPVPLSIVVRGIFPDSTIIRTRIQDSIRDRLRISAEPGGAIPLSWIANAINTHVSLFRGLTVNGASDLSSNILLTTGQYPYIQSVTFADS